MENQDYLKKIEELKSVSKKKFLEHSVVEGKIAERFINNVYNKFKPFKITDHLSIGSDISKKMATDEFEFSFSEIYLSGSIYVFFEQDYYNKNQIFVLKEGKLFSKLIEECYGMEYFITNENNSFLISVNWYIIEMLFENDR
ncbi:hypothetical protein [Chryseobacterium luquanense]|uniref:Uncharacterized protein n=1 Tax=Chryseobacterium luquanense TaxID=2983766 RepID=A0ABT3Y9N9_9FLAO|nr:hypothetical protein [Chryseobacterium luquanense]MCX8534711.1 hypothetical protein [Chryseobacterium luquanense]